MPEAESGELAGVFAEAGTVCVSYREDGPGTQCHQGPWAAGFCAQQKEGPASGQRCGLLTRKAALGSTL